MMPLHSHTEPLSLMSATFKTMACVEAVSEQIYDNKKQGPAHVGGSQNQKHFSEGWSPPVLSGKILTKLKSDTTTRNRACPGDLLQVTVLTPSLMSLLQAGDPAPQGASEIPAAATDGARASSPDLDHENTDLVDTAGVAGGKTGPVPPVSAAQSGMVTPRKVLQAIVNMNQLPNVVLPQTSWSQNGTGPRAQYARSKFAGSGYPAICQLRPPVGCAHLTLTQSGEEERGNHRRALQGCILRPGEGKARPPMGKSSTKRMPQVMLRICRIGSRVAN